MIHYTPQKTAAGWSYTTPLGTVEASCRQEADRLAEFHLRQDHAMAATGSGLGAVRLMDYFSQEVASS